MFMLHEITGFQGIVKTLKIARFFVYIDKTFGRLMKKGGNNGKASKKYSSLEKRKRLLLPAAG
jgi:hypothetical protein